MQPTMKLRYVGRWHCEHYDSESAYVKVLQQWWEPSCQYGCSEAIDYGTSEERWIENINGAGEWRDVPMEDE